MTQAAANRAPVAKAYANTGSSVLVSSFPELIVPGCQVREYRDSSLCIKLCCADDYTIKKGVASGMQDFNPFESKSKIRILLLVLLFYYFSTNN